MRKAVRKAIGEETMRFLRGKYALDEVGNEKDQLEFRDGNGIILTIFIRKRRYDFRIGERTIRVTDLESLEEAKQLILARKAPNRKSFPTENAVYSRCGHRCDLCQHYIGGSNSEAFRAKLIEHVKHVYGSGPDHEVPPCQGCAHGGLDGKADCRQLKCAAKKGLEKCQDCRKYNRECSPGVGYNRGIEPRGISAEDVTWAILPYISEQYSN